MINKLLDLDYEEFKVNDLVELDITKEQLEFLNDYYESKPSNYLKLNAKYYIEEIENRYSFDNGELNTETLYQLCRKDSNEPVNVQLKEWEFKKIK